MIIISIGNVKKLKVKKKNTRVSIQKLETLFKTRIKNKKEYFVLEFE